MPRGYPLVGFAARPSVPIETRLWAKVEKRGRAACWPWTASTLRDGRGKIMHEGKLRPAPRVIVSLRDGLPIDGDWVTRHTCNWPPCCNPAHLVSGSQADNAADTVAAGHSTRGEKHGMAKLTNRQRAEIRNLRTQGVPRKEVAERYGVHPETVTKLCRMMW